MIVRASILPRLFRVPIPCEVPTCWGKLPRSDPKESLDTPERTCRGDAKAEIRRRDGRPCIHTRTGGAPLATVRSPSPPFANAIKAQPCCARPIDHAAGSLRSIPRSSLLDLLGWGRRATKCVGFHGRRGACRALLRLLGRRVGRGRLRRELPRVGSGKERSPLPKRVDVGDAGAVVAGDGGL